MTDRYEPLSPQELAAVPVYGDGDTTSHDEGFTLVAPVPENHPPRPEHRKLGKPTKCWKYYSASAEVLFFACRFDPPGERKAVLPLTMWLNRDGGLVWDWKVFPDPRPLYNLNRLADKPTAPVIVVEGEKCADAASEIFPDYVSTTSSGGASAVSKTDWTPLAGRDVIIWRDADEPGLKYENDVADILAKFGCKVRVVDAMTLASMHPDGGTRDPAECWDCDDALEEWENLPALRKAVLGLAKPSERAPVKEQPLVYNFAEPNACGPRSGSDCGDEPLPLFPPLEKSMPYPLEALGGLRDAAEAIVRKVQVPGALAAQSVLAIAAHAAQAHANVALPFGQSRPLSLFMATIAGSGDRKSSADNEAAWPIVKREKALHEEYREAMQAYKISATAWQAEKRRIESDKRLDFREKSAALTNIGPEPLPPLAPFLIVNDMTLDGLMKNWVNAHASLGIFTAEGGTFTSGHGMSDENRLRTAASLSEVWDGKTIKRVRSLDGVTLLPGRRLSLHVLLQPDVAHGFLGNPVLRDQGLLSRILVAAPESLAGGRFYREPDPADDKAIQDFGARILSILEAPQPLADNRNELKPRDLRMTSDATELWVQFFNQIESQSSPNGELARLRDFASKAAEHAARIAGVLTLFDNLHADEIGYEAMQNAIALLDWYLAEAERLHSASRLDPNLLRAESLLAWFVERGDGPVPFREILQFGPAPLRTKKAADNAISVLLDHRQIIQTETRPRAYRLNSVGV